MFYMMDFLFFFIIIHFNLDTHFIIHKLLAEIGFSKFLNKILCI